MSYILSNPLYVIIFAFVFLIMYFYASYKLRKTGKPHYRMMRGILAAVIVLLAISAIARQRAGL